jgi:Cys-rich protein (TIGR01571 family)
MLDECSPVEMGKDIELQSVRPTLVVERASTVVVAEPDEKKQRKWKTDVMSCNTDEETSWWGFWCPWLLQARTAHSFNVSTSKTQIGIFCCFVTGFPLSSFCGPVFLILYTAVAGSFFAYSRAVVRYNIRKKLQIDGSFCEDYGTHCCCTCCAVCQEAREEKMTYSRRLDFCSGEELLSQERDHQRAIGHGEGLSDSLIPEVRN